MLHSSPKLRVKICCISSEEEADLAVRYGADALGLVSAMPSGPGIISDELIKRICSKVPPSISTFLLTSHTEADQIIEQNAICGCDVIQLCDRMNVQQLQKLRGVSGGTKLVQVVHITGIEVLDYALDVAPFVDGLLLDTGDPGLPIKILGGTGREHDWNISRLVCRSVTVPVFLAGGLYHENVVKAVDTVRPFGVDVCSRIRTDGRLDESKLAKFLMSLTSIENRTI